MDRVPMSIPAVAMLCWCVTAALASENAPGVGPSPGGGAQVDGSSTPAVDPSNEGGAISDGSASSGPNARPQPGPSPRMRDMSRRLRAIPPETPVVDNSQFLAPKGSLQVRDERLMGWDKEGSAEDGVLSFCYMNVIRPIEFYFPPGANVAMADDLTLSAGSTEVGGYKLLVFGGNVGEDFDVHVELWDGQPGAGGVLIPGTEADFLAVPDDGLNHVLTKRINPAVAAPPTVWMVVTFSTANAGWIITEAGEVGSTVDSFAWDVPWGLYFFNGDPYAGFAAKVGCPGGGAGGNDECEGCTEVVEGVPLDGSNVGSTGTDITSCAFEDFTDVWHCYTPSCTGTATISTCGNESMDTTLAVFDSCGGAELACIDDFCGLQSELQVQVTAGETYYIRVAGYNGAQGDYTLNVSCMEPSGNDLCADAETIGDGDTSFSTIGAGTDGPELPPDCEEGFGLFFVNDIWYDYTATCTGDLVVSTCNIADYDTRLAAYEGFDCPVDNDRLVGCNDDGEGCTGFTSEMVFPVVEGGQYKLRVGGFAGSGTGTLNITCDAANPACVGAAGSCFETHDTPGCDDAGCCDQICDLDSFCCDVAWDEGCVDNANIYCATPPNDNCEDTPIEQLPFTFTGSNLNATSDCALFPGENVWIAFELPTDSAVHLEYCGSDPVFGNAWLNLAIGCPCESFTAAGSFNFTDCADGNVTIEWDFMTAGTYYYPVLTEPGSEGIYNITVTAGEPIDACEGATGDCFVGHGGIGCDDLDCCHTVCAIDPFCCDVAWDDICAGEAADLCTP